MKIEEIVKERIKENQNLFAREELQVIKKNHNIIKKIYLIGIIDGKRIYGKNLQ